MATRIPLASFLKEKVQALYLQPGSFRRDKLRNRHATLHFQVAAKLCADNLPPAMLQAFRLLTKVRPTRTVVLDSSEENVSLFVSTPPNGHDSVCIKGADLRKIRLFSESKTGEVQIRFQAAIDPTTNSEFMVREYGNDVMLFAESSPELLSAEEELPDAPAQKPLDFPEVAADPKRKKKAKSTGKAPAKVGAEIPRQQTARRKPLPKPKDRKQIAKRKK